MTPEKVTKTTFNTASKMTSREAHLMSRAEKAIERLGARHQANQAGQVAKRFGELVRSDRPMPSLKPQGVVEDRRGWLMRVAQYQIKQEHGARLDRVRDVAKAMSKGQPNQQTNRKRGGDELGR